MLERLAAAVIACVLIGYMLMRARAFLAAQWFLVQMWRWHTGMPHHGKPLTDAGWFRHGTRALTPTGHAHPWWFRPRWQRSAHRSSVSLGLFTLTAGLLTFPVVTCGFVVFAVFLVLAWQARRLLTYIRARPVRQTWLRPLHAAIAPIAGVPPHHRPDRWLTVTTDKDGAVTRAEIRLPLGVDDRARPLLVSTAAGRLAIEAPDTRDTVWHGASPLLVLTHSEPPPSQVGWDDVADAVARKHSNELVCGLGKRRQVVKVSLSQDSPHLGINSGSGGGKSEQAKFWTMQHLHDGGILMILDIKQQSQPWTIKDAAAAYDQLPNVAYCDTLPKIHAGMVWLGDELARRSKEAQRIVDSRGVLHGDIGPRLMVLAEELNLAMEYLPGYWRALRDPERDPVPSPALAGFGATSFAGRALKMHDVFVGQMVTAAATGRRDSSVKASVGVWVMARYGPQTWKTAVGDVPMPPVPKVLGRHQLVVARNVTEFQGPLIDGQFAREYAMAGTVTACPAGMPGAVTVTGRPVLDSGPDQSGVTVTGPRPGPGVTLREAVRLGLVRSSRDALKMARHRDKEHFPKPVDLRGTEYVYDPDALARYDLARRT